MKDQIVEYIQQHCCDNSLSLVSVADSIGMNPTYLSAFIKEQLGETFLNYVLNLRMELATELLRTTDLSQQDIAVRIGYANSGAFFARIQEKVRHNARNIPKTKSKIARFFAPYKIQPIPPKRSLLHLLLFIKIIHLFQKADSIQCISPRL